MMQGIRRRLFSNETGISSTANAAAVSARHPATQGMLQMVSVFLATIVVCSATAFIILLSGVRQESGLGGVRLTQLAMTSQFGGVGGHFPALAVFLFSSASIIGNSSYAEGNVEFLSKSRPLFLGFRLVVLATVPFDGKVGLPLAWDMTDASMGIMALINLSAIVLLSRYFLMTLKDYREQLRAGSKVSLFVASRCLELAAKIGASGQPLRRKGSLAF